MNMRRIPLNILKCKDRERRRKWTGGGGGSREKGLTTITKGEKGKVWKKNKNNKT